MIRDAKRRTKTRKKFGKADVGVIDFERMFDPFDVVYLQVRFAQNVERRLLGNRKVSEVLLTQGKDSSSLSGSVHLDEMDDAFIMTLNRHLTQALFRPSPAVASLVDQRLSFSPSTTTDNTSSSLVPQGFVAVHARTGGDINEATEARMHFINTDMTTHATRLLDCASEIMHTNQNNIFLASDSLAFKSVFISVATARGMRVSTQNDRASVHIRHYARQGFGEEEEEEEVTCLRFLDVFADAFALGRGRALVGRPSSFVVAAWELGAGGEEEGGGGGVKRMIQLFLGVGRKEGECDVRRIAMEERNRKDRGVDRRKEDMSHFSKLWYDGEEGTVGIITGAERGPAVIVGT